MKKRTLLPIMLAIVFTFGIALAACTPSETKPIIVAQPVYSGAALTYGDDLPAITTTTTGGSIELDKNQTLTAGTKDYSWTFTPDSTELRYENLKGKISLTVSKAGQEVPQDIELECSESSDTEVILMPLGDSYEYSMRAGESDDLIWQADNVFGDLTPETDYTFFARLKGDDNHNPSAAIELDVRTGEIRQTSDQYFVYKGNKIIELTALGIEQTSLVIPAKHNDIEIKTIGQMAFMYADLLETIKIPFGIETIEDSAFMGCSSLKEIFIPVSVTTVGNNVFGACYALTEAYYGGSNLDGWSDTEYDTTTIFCYSKEKPDEVSNTWRYVGGVTTPWYMAVRQPTYTGSMLFYGYALPQITTVTKGGTIELDDNQILTAGIKDYAWTFTPYDGVNTEYTNITGTISLEVNKSRQPLPSGAKLETEEILSTKVTLLSLGESYEYSADKTDWQESNVFEGLTQATDYVFYARIKGTDNLWPSETLQIPVRTLQTDPIAVVQPVYSGGTLYYGDALPAITTSTTGGSIVLDAEQALIVGTQDYTWTFTPDNTDIVFTGLTGTISLTVEKALVAVKQPVYSGATLCYGDALPLITTSTTGGTVKLDAGQTLVAGTYDYTWTFTPEDTANYEYTNLIGTIALTVEKAGQTIPEGIEIECENATDTEITLSPLGFIYEYSLDNAAWQDSNVFGGLVQATKYTFYARLKGDGNRNPSIAIRKDIYTAQVTPITVVQPIYSGGILKFGMPLPAISTTTTGGTVSLDAEQTLAVGTHDYTWTFTPENSSFEYLNVTGTISLTVEKAAQSIPGGTVLHPENIAARSVTFIISTGNDSLYEFSLDAISWQDSNVFENLTPDTEYTFYARLKGDENHEPSTCIFKDVRTKVEIIDPGADQLFEIEDGVIVSRTPLGEEQTFLTIPEEYNGTAITTIGEYALSWHMVLAGVLIPKSITSIESWAFSGCYGLTKIFYAGTADDWSKMTISEDAFDGDISDILYFYSEEEPAEAGNYWHYVDGVPTVWA